MLEGTLEGAYTGVQSIFQGISGVCSGACLGTHTRDWHLEMSDPADQILLPFAMLNGP